MNSMAGHSTLTDPQSVLPPLSDHQVQRIIASNTFKSAPTLQQLFQFLATRALDGHPDEIKEYTIGVEALGRKQDFDPKIDPIVRVQIYRLRHKLKEYYEMEGASDSILVEVPKGHYLPTFKLAKAGTPTLHEVPAPQRVVKPAEPTMGNIEVDRRGLSLRAVAILIVSIVAAFAAGFLVNNYWHRRQENAVASSVRPDAAADDPVKAFWANFIREDPAPIIAYADAVFLLDGSSDLFRFRHGASDDRGASVDPHVAREFASNPSLVAKAGPLYYDNGYTGTGELEGVAMLTSLFTQMGARPTVESSYDITTDDLKRHNIVLLGSPFQNVAVAQLPARGDFLFLSADARGDLWNDRIANSHARPNEKPYYQTERDPATGTVKADYALISFEPGVTPGRHIVDLGGLDTKGTEGAVLLATSASGVEKLSGAISEASIRQKIPAFQALLKVNLEKGYQVLNTELLAVHPIPDEAATKASASR
jgi:hypothetical protein